MKYEVIGWWEQQSWIPLWIDNYEVRIGLYRYFNGILIEPFLDKFWFDVYDKSFDESFSVFQTILLTCGESSLRWYLDKKWFEVVWVKNINFKIIKKWKKDFLDKYTETWDDFEMKQYLEKVKLWELSFWFIPWENNWFAVIFAKPKKVDLWEITLSKTWETKNEVSWLLKHTPTPEELTEASKPWEPLHWLTI